MPQIVRFECKFVAFSPTFFNTMLYLTAESAMPILAGEEQGIKSTQAIRTAPAISTISLP